MNDLSADMKAVDWVRDRVGHQAANDLSEYLYGPRLITPEPGLREALEEAVAWEAEYRSINNLGNGSPYWVGMARAALAALTPESDSRGQAEMKCSKCGRRTSCLSYIGGSNGLCDRCNPQCGAAQPSETPAPEGKA